MAVDKNKVTAEATRYAQRGQWDRAIKAYERILAEDPKDVRALLKVGELHQKRGDEAAAASTFGRVAEAYSEQGFFLKAIAVYKQMIKLAPDDIRVNERLAGLYQQLGIMSDAMAQLQVVAAAVEKQGDQQKLLDVLGRMAEIEPDNVGSAVKLGEIHARGGRTAEALDHFRRAADLLRKANRADEYLRVAERIAFLAPDDMALTRELANIYLAKGDTKRALGKLQLCFKADPKDIDTLNLLAQAFRDLGQTTKTLSVYKELAHVYAEKGRADEARGTWKKVLELAPEDPDAAAGIIGAVAAPPPPPPLRAPGPPPGVRPAVIAPPPPPAAAAPAPRPAPAPTPAPAARSAAPARTLGPEAIPKLLTETDVYVKYGLHQKALDHLRKVFEIDPHHLDAREKARDIRAMAGDATGAAEEGAQALRLCDERGLADRAAAAQARLREIAPTHPALGGAVEPPPVPVEEVVLIEPEPTPAAVPVEEDFLVEDTAVEVDDLALSGAEVGVEDVVDDDEAALAAAGAADEQVVDEEQILEEEGPVAGDEPLGPPPVAAAPMAFPAPVPLRTSPPAVRLTPPPPPVRLTPPPAPHRLTPPPAPTRLTPPPAPPPALTPPPRPLARVQPVHVAVPAPPQPPREVAAPPPPAATRQAAPPPPPPGRSALPPQPVPHIAPAAPPPGTAVPPPPPVAEEREEELDLGDEIEEADFFMQQGLFAEAREALRNLAAFYPGHSQVAGKLAELDRREAGARRPSVATPPPAPPPSGVFDIGKELAEELGAEAAPLPAEEFQYTVEEVFSQFKKGVSQVVKAEDTDTHYDLGIAYKEMGLVDDALSEFETALQGAAPAKQVDCLSMIGLCRMASGDAGGAAVAFRRALRAEAMRPEAARALHYELASAYQALGDTESSLWYLHKVVRADATFRDAAARLKSLGGGPGRAPPEAPATPPAAGGPKKNIGYV